jgi:hypothetical protein
VIDTVRGQIPVSLPIGPVWMTGHIRMYGGFLPQELLFRCLGTGVVVLTGSVGCTTGPVLCPGQAIAGPRIVSTQRPAARGAAGTAGPPGQHRPRQ